MPRLHREQQIRLALDEAFRFFEDPANLSKITPAKLHLVITNGPITMRAGAEIVYTLRRMFIPLGWRTRITVYNPPHGFTDIEVRGPFAKWVHTHTFIADGENTRMIDDIEYELPFRPLGPWVAGWLIKRQLDAIFDYRRSQIDKLLNA